MRKIMRFLIIVVAIFLLAITFFLYLCHRGRWKVTANPSHADFLAEKSEILERANWLCEQVLVEPEELFNKMPNIGEHFMGEWALYTCAYSVAALRNISDLYPETRDENLPKMQRLISIAMSPLLRKYDTDSWGKDVWDDDDLDNSHMTYLSVLAWMISNYKLAGGRDWYDDTYKECCEALHVRMLRSRNLCLPSFPGDIIFMPDMLVPIVALHNYGLIYDTRYEATVSTWIAKAQAEWLDKRTGLLQSYLFMKPSRHAPVRGSYTALNCYYLSLIDDNFAQEQYHRMKQYMLHEDTLMGAPLCGVREYLYKCPTFKFDVDAGPIALGFSPSGTAWAIGPATYFGDWEFRYRMLRTAETAGMTTHRKNTRHYRLANFALVGEAVVLAMRTHKHQD